MNKGEMFVFNVGKLTYSNIILRSDVIFGITPHKHIFWRFWLAQK